MTHAFCPDCRLRFAPVTAAHLSACPECGEPIQRSGRREETVGCRLFRIDRDTHSLPGALSVALPPPDPRPRRQ